MILPSVSPFKYRKEELKILSKYKKKIVVRQLKLQTSSDLKGIFFFISQFSDKNISVYNELFTYFEQQVFEYSGDFLVWFKHIYFELLIYVYIQ